MARAVPSRRDNAASLTRYDNGRRSRGIGARCLAETAPSCVTRAPGDYTASPRRASKSRISVSSAMSAEVLSSAGAVKRSLAIS